jgi:type IV pilus assembly protein PilY1
MTRLSSFKNKISKCTPKLITAALSFSCAKSFATDSVHGITGASPASHGAPMKTNLSLACIALLLFSAQVSALKDPPPGAGVSGGKANILLMLDNSGSMNGVVNTDVLNKPSDVVIDSHGNLHVLNNEKEPYGNRVLLSKYKPDLTPSTGYGYISLVDPETWKSERGPKLAIDGADNIYIAKYSSSDGPTGKIWKFNSAGSKVGTVSATYPLGIDIDSKGYIWITAGSGVAQIGLPGIAPFFVRKIDVEGKVLQEWEIDSTEKWDAFVTTGGEPRGISVYDEKVYVVSQIIQSRPGNPLSAGKKNAHPHRTSNEVDCKLGYPVRVYDAKTGEQLAKWYALGGHDIEVNANGVYVVGHNNHGHIPESTDSTCGGQVGKYSHDGVFKTRFAPKKVICAPDTISTPVGITSDSNGNIYVAGGGGIALSSYPYAKSPLSVVKKYSANGDYLGTVEESTPRKIAVKCVLKRLLESPSVTDKANFGLQIWSSNAEMLVKVSETGKDEILPMLCDCLGEPISGSCAKCNNIIPYDNRMSQASTWPGDGFKLAKKYYNNSASGFTPGPIDPTGCEPHGMLFFSDGYWYESDASIDPAVTHLANKLGVKTYVVGFAIQGVGSVRVKYMHLADVGGSLPITPIFAKDEEKLQRTIETLATQMRQTGLSFTGTAPKIVSDSSGDYIYQTTFAIPLMGQWSGKIKKSALMSSTGRVGDLIWEAGAELNKKRADARNIWTAAPGFSSGLDNFQTSSVATLKPLLYDGVDPFPTDDKARKLINFVRGQDTYDEDNNESTFDQRMWKLGESYHSEIVVVPPPKALDDSKLRPGSEETYKKDNNYEAFVAAQANRPAMVYVGANDGMLHAFKDSTGEELWGFIPPQVLPKLRLMDSGIEHITIPIYGVDGSPAVKDVFLNGQWRTVLMAGLGREGYGYFALDVTNPSSPSFLFAFENDPQNEVIRHWADNGTLTVQDYSSVSSGYNYKKLGEALATPTIVSIPNTTGVVPRPIAAIGGGLNNTDDKSYGSAVYLIDLADQGKVWKVIDLPDAAGGFNNSHPAQVTAVTADTTSAATYKGAMLYSADMESKLSKINVTDIGTVHAVTELFDGEGNNVNQRASFMPVTTTTDSAKKVWAYFGTGNQDRLQLSQSTIQNSIFGIKDKKFPLFESTGKSTISKLKDVTNAGATCPAEDNLGWYVNLGRDERVTGKIAINKKVLFAPLYTPDSTQPCFPGASALLELGYSCGKSLRRTELGGGYIAGARIYKDKIYLGVSGIPDSDNEVAVGNTFMKKGNIISGDPAAIPGASGSQETVIESWREKL